MLLDDGHGLVAENVGGVVLHGEREGKWKTANARL